MAAVSFQIEYRIPRLPVEIVFVTEKSKKKTTILKNIYIELVQKMHRNFVINGKNFLVLIN